LSASREKAVSLLNKIRTMLSVVIPAFDEAESLPALLEELSGVLGGLGQPYEIVVVDDGSTDDTPSVLKRLQTALPALRVLTLARRAGQSAALFAGCEAAQGDVVVTLDADCQNDPADIARLLSHLEDHDVVCGVRAERRDNFLRRISSRVANASRRSLLGDDFTDVGCALKAFPRRDLLALRPFDGMHRFLPVLLRWRGLRVIEVPVHHRPRRAGRPKYNVRNRLVRTLADVLGVRWLKSRQLRYEIKR
jgi:glycosyltransferase involved in cell wall biosynthesis